MASGQLEAVDKVPVHSLRAEKWQNNVPSALSTPLPLTHEGFGGFSFATFYCKTFLCMITTFSKLFFLATLNTSNMSSALANMVWITSTG